MTSSAQQYRSLVDKLEQLSELKIGDINPATGKRIVSGATDSQGNLIQSGTPGVYWNAKEEPVEPAAAPAAEPAAAPAAEPAAAEPAPAPAATPAQEKCGPEVKEKIKAQKTFNAAYALAKQSGCDEFDWCQIVNVPTQMAQSGKPVAPAQKPQRQWNWQKGELTNEPGSDLPPAAESIELEEASFVPGSVELDRIREIAGTAIVEQNMPEIKASSKQKAIEIARKQGIKQFRFCGKYKVQDAPAKRQQSGKPIASEPQRRRQFGGLNPNVELGPQSGSDLPIAP